MKRFKYLFLVCFISLCCSGYALAQEKDVDGGVTLGWDANIESDLESYQLYIGTTSGDYDNVINVGNQTRYTATRLVVGTTYYFSLTALDTWKNESGYSVEVSAVAKDIILPKSPANFKEVTPNINNFKKGQNYVTDE